MLQVCSKYNDLAFCEIIVKSCRKKKMEKLILWLSPFSEVAAIGDLNIVPNFYHSITFSSRKKTREHGCPLPPRYQYNHSESFFRLFSCSEYCLKILALNHIVTQERLREIIFCQPFFSGSSMCVLYCSVPY